MNDTLNKGLGQLAAYLAIIVCAIIWGLAGPFIRWSQLGISSIVALRFFLPAILAWCWIRFVQRRVISLPTQAMWIAAVLHLISTVLYVCAFSFTSISHALLILYVRPVITTFLGAVLLKELVTRRLWILLSVSFFGAMIILTEREISLDNHDFIGMAFALLTALTSSSMFVLLKAKIYSRHDPIQIMLFQHLPGAAIALPVLVYVVPGWDIQGFAFGAMYAGIVGFGGSLLYFYGQRALPVSRAMPLTYLELLVAIVVGHLFFHDELTFRATLGGFMIVTSAYLSTRK